jgi:hypothetical protein
MLHCYIYINGVVWCGVVWCGVVWCDVMWCGVVWCGVLVHVLHPSKTHSLQLVPHSNIGPRSL